MIITFFSIIVLSMVAPLGGYLYVAAFGPAAVAQEDARAENPISDFWRVVRRGEDGYSAAAAGDNQAFLIQNGGEIWRQFRNGPVVTIGAIVMGAALAALVLFHLIAGAAKLKNGRSGVKVYRWTMFERVLHWFVAILFILLAITGLSLLFGREVLIPVLGLQGFAAYAEFAKWIHNYAGVLFSVGLVIMLALWFRESLFKKHDWEWFKQGGGYIGNKHPHAGRVNAGEKVWFWMLFLAGLAVTVSGLVLNFPNLDFDLETNQWANVIHASLSMLLIALSFGHIYLGTLGNEGSFEGMWTGYVDANWAEQHHDLWYHEVRQRGTEPPPRHTQEAPPQTSPG